MWTCIKCNKKFISLKVYPKCPCCGGHTILFKK